MHLLRRHPTLLAAAAALTLVSCAPRTGDPVVAPEPAGTAPLAPRGATATAQRHMVVAANPHAAEAGLEILRAGGTAADAAIATVLVLNLVEPQSSGIGGGGFLLHFDARNRAVESYDGRETAPAAADPGMFLDATGKPRPFDSVVAGGLSVGVPGTLRMLEQVHREHGRLPWARLFEPAVRLAENGFPVSQRLHDLVAADSHLRDFPAARSLFFTPSGEPLPAGAPFRNPEMAATLRVIAAQGPDAFYSGEIARDVAAATREAPFNPGRLSAADLAAYHAVRRPPVCSEYRLWIVCGMGPPSSGGIATQQILGILQAFDIEAADPLPAVTAHLLAEAGRLAFADRNAFVADSDFVPVPVQSLLDPAYLAARARQIDPRHAMGKAQPGDPLRGQPSAYAADETIRGFSTTHFDVVDGDGNAVSATVTIEAAFGSRVLVRGFLLNNEMTDFSFLPASGGKPVANAVAPGKRPRSSMAPTLVFRKSDQGLALAIGSPGGGSIIGYVAQALVGALDGNLPLAAVVAQPHVLNLNGATQVEKRPDADGLAEALRAMGHEVERVDLTSGLHAIRLDGGRLEGAADPRREGVAKGD